MTTRPSPEIEERARRRLAADEARTTGATRRTSQSLGEVWRVFWRHPSPWLIGATFLGALAWRAADTTYAWTDLVVPVALVVCFPLIEWVIHVVVLHWRPRRLGPVAVDSLLSRKHRAHHADPRDLPLVFVPWQVELWVLPAYVVVGLLAFPSGHAGASFVVAASGLMLGYEWVHYLVHSDYRPRSRAFRAVWRNHRLHHYKNEHYWFTVTTSGTADRLLGTYPEPGSVETSPTVRALHAQEQSVGPGIS